ATAAGLVGFALGSETLGSIVSPASRCGVTGLRPTFGRVSRRGAMPLAWSMDKIGPICRNAEDCAVVLAAIQGPDGLDPTVRSVPWGWDGDVGAEGLRVGYLNSAFARERSAGGLDREALASLSAMEVDLRGVELPTGLPLEALRIILDAEAAAAFDELTRGDLDDRLVGQEEDRWPNRLRVARFVPAVEYIRANRIRTMLLSAMEEAWTGLDVIVAPTFAPGLLIATNLSGHPAVVVPNGLRPDGTPGSLSFIGPPWGEAEVLRLAKAYQERTRHHLDRPPAFS
ncbi:MAG: amidase, partial [Gemmatimonadota bacterium]